MQNPHTRTPKILIILIIIIIIIELIFISTREN
jgi:hypothetical protein